MFANRLFASIHLCALVIRANKSLNFKEVSEIVPAPGAHRLPSFLILLERESLFNPMKIMCLPLCFFSRLPKKNFAEKIAIL